MGRETMRYKVKAMSSINDFEVHFETFDDAINFSHRFQKSTDFRHVEIKELIPGRGYAVSLYEKTPV